MQKSPTTPATVIQSSLFGVAVKSNHVGRESAQPHISSQPQTQSQGNSSLNYLLVLTRRGLIKKTPLEEFPQKGRATGGVATLLFSTTDDKVEATRIVGSDEDFILIGIGKEAAIAIELNKIPVLARAKKGQAVEVVRGGAEARVVIPSIRSKGDE